MALRLNTHSHHGHNYPDGHVVVHGGTYRVRGEHPNGKDKDLTAVAFVYKSQEEYENYRRPIWRLWFEFTHIPKDDEDMLKQAYKALKKHDKMKDAVDVDSDESPGNSGNSGKKPKK